MNGACGTSLLERFFGRKRLLLTARNPIGAQPGDEVVFGVSEDTLLKASFAAYLIPLLALIAGGIAGGALGEALLPAGVEVLSVVGGIVGLAAALFWLVAFSRARETDSRYCALILRCTGPSSAHHAIPLRARLGQRRPDSA